MIRSKRLRVAMAIFLALILATIGAYRLRQSAISTASLGLKSGNYGVALNELRPWATLGDSQAQYWLGMHYAFGWDVTKDDAVAIDWFRRAHMWREPNVAAEAPAEYEVGDIYMNGLGVPKDEAEAKKWFERSAAGGFHKAAVQLERMSDHGQ